MIAVLFAALLEVHVAQSPVRVDAVLDEPVWAQATPIPLPYEWYPGDNVPAPVATEVLVAHDDENLYVAFRAKDPDPSRIRARFHERDAAFDDDLVGFLVDPFNDDRRAFQFRVNPLGVQIDAINSDVEGSEDLTWDAIWESAGRLTADGYVVEIAVPLQQLRMPSNDEPHAWGFMAMRDYPRGVRHRMRSVRTDQNRDCLVCQFDDLHGFVTRMHRRNIEVTPTITGTNDDPFDAGITGRWAITPGTSLQATLNPDFSQVEADAAQLDVNTRFALFFPEKRPFFVEGADVFETRLPLVFTRTIAEPEAGVKLTGKAGKNLYGALFARDAITNLLIPGDQSSTVTSLDRESWSSSARYRREIGASATLGGLVTARSGEDYENLVAAADGYYRITESDSLRMQVSGSRTRYPAAIAEAFEQPEGTFEGHAVMASYNHGDRNWFWGADYTEIAPDFRADSGFINQVGVRGASAFAERRLRGGPERWFSNIYLSTGFDVTRQFDGEWQEWGADLGATYQGPMQSSISFNLAPNQEYFDGRTYHNFRHSLSASFQPHRDITASLYVNQGETIDFNHSQQADFVSISPELTLNLGRRFRGELAHVWEVLDSKQGERIYSVHLPQARLLYHFSRRAYLRSVLQYQMFDSPDGDSEELLTQLLFSYRLNAQTVFLAGYSDNYEGERDLSRTDRAVFVKLGYAFLF